VPAAVVAVELPAHLARGSFCFSFVCSLSLYWLEFLVGKCDSFILFSPLFRSKADLLGSFVASNVSLVWGEENF
jgi:hypothetical protein